MPASSSQSHPQTLFEKIWQRHEVVPPPEPGMPSVLAIDLHLIHEVTSPQAFAELRRRGLRVRRPSQTLATMDHSTPTEPRIDLGRLRSLDASAADQLEALAKNCAEFEIPILPLGDPRQGIVHVIAPELGCTQPGMTVVCGDSHTSTHGAFGALAFGIGTSEVGHVLASQCLLQHKPKTLEIRVDGRLRPGVTAKDLILAVIGRIGVHGGTGHVIEYTGEAIRALTMEERMTVCNMSIEGGARAGLIAPDETTYAYLEGRPAAPARANFARAVEAWSKLPSDPGAAYDRVVQLDASELTPMITYGTHPGTALPIGGRIPQRGDVDPSTSADLDRACEYMGFEPGQLLRDIKIDVVFVGSCTNSRLSDLEAAAGILRGRQVAPGVRMLVVPGSQQVKRRAEELGLHRIFLDAGAEWREAGCSMCLAMNGDRLRPGEVAVSTSNRNFEGRQGPGGRTLLASPATAAACAVAGSIRDPREVDYA